MSKSRKIASKAIYGMTDLLMKPVYDMLKEEKKANDKKYHLSMLEAAQDVLAESYDNMQPKTHEVHQPFDSIIHEDDFW